MTRLVGSYGLFSAADAEPQFAGSGVLGTASPSILFDGKALVDDGRNLYDNEGTGSFTFQSNKMQMSVTSGQWAVRASRRVMPYFSGYPAIVETTFDNFQSEAGVTKRMGYFSTSSTSPYSAAADGFFIEDNGTGVKYFCVWRGGSEIFRIPDYLWIGANGRTACRASDGMTDYDWSKFGVIMFDFLWLGGAVLRMWLRLQDRWQLLHQVAMTGKFKDVIFTSPQHRIRYEIRSSTGEGSLRAICSQFSVLGDVANKGYLQSIVDQVGQSATSAGTTYALVGLKLDPNYPNLAAELERISALRDGGPSDVGILLLLKNPTLSGALTYSSSGRLQAAVAAGQTVTDDGTVILTTPASATPAAIISGNYNRWMTMGIDHVSDEYVLAYRALTANQTVHGIVEVKEHG